MNITEIRQAVAGSEYDFLRTDKRLADNIMILALGGSIAYGTDVPESDIDVRGITLNSSKELFGLCKDFENIVDKETDTTVYSLLKMNKLLFNCNPNTIEILGCKPEHYLYINKYGQRILDNKSNYLSVAAIKSFGCYANDQYDRLEHGLLGNGQNDTKKIQMLKHSLERSITAFNTMHKGLNMNLRMDIASVEEYKRLFGIDIEETNNSRILVTGSFKKVPVTNFKSIISQIHKIQSDYGNINKRNTKKSDAKLAKHMMHLIRLYMMGIDLNTTGKITTYHEGKRHELLMDIRLGKYMHPDGMKVLPEFYDILHDIQKDYEYSVVNNTLPMEPNYEAIECMMSDIYSDKLAER